LADDPYKGGGILPGILLWNSRHPERLITLELKDRDGPQRGWFSQDSKWVVTTDSEKTARIWDAESGALLRVMPRERDVECAVFSPDGTQVITAEGAVVFRDFKKGNILRMLGTVESGFQQVLTSGDGHLLATANGDDAVRVWDLATLSPLTPPLQNGAKPFLKFSPDSQRLLAWGDRSSLVRVWDITRGGLETAVLKHAEMVANADFSHDSERIITCSHDGTARVWSALTGEPVGVPLQHPGGVYSGHFSATDDTLITAGADRTAKLWDFKACDLPAEDIQGIAELLSGHRLGEGGGIHPLLVEAIVERHAAFAKKHPTLFQESTAERRALWHDELSLRAHESGLWDAAAWHGVRALETSTNLQSEPTIDELFRRLGQDCGQLGRWSEAITAFDRAAKSAPRLTLHRLNLGRILLGAGRKSEYAALCRFALQDFKQSLEGPTEWYNVRVFGNLVRLCTLDKVDDIDLTSLLKVAHKVEEVPWFRDKPLELVPARLYYRAGDAKNALQSMAHDAELEQMSAELLYWSTLVYELAGKKAEAKDLLAKAIAADEDEAVHGDPTNVKYHIQLTNRILRKQAEATVSKSD
jgi:tetratricopeptide (TPR) repeat protein